MNKDGAEEGAEEEDGAEEGAEEEDGAEDKVEDGAADSSQARPRRGRRQLVPEENAAQNQANHEEQLVVMLYI